MINALTKKGVQLQPDWEEQLQNAVKNGEFSFNYCFVRRFIQFFVSFTDDAIGTDMLINNCFEIADSLIASNLLRLAVEKGKPRVFESRQLKVFELNVILILIHSQSRKLECH